MNIEFPIPSKQQMLEGIKEEYKIDCVENAWFDSAEFEFGNFEFSEGIVHWKYTTLDFGDPIVVDVFAQWKQYVGDGLAIDVIFEIDDVTDLQRNEEVNNYNVYRKMWQ